MDLKELCFKLEEIRNKSIKISESRGWEHCGEYTVHDISEDGYIVKRWNYYDDEFQFETITWDELKTLEEKP